MLVEHLVRRVRDLLRVDNLRECDIDRAQNSFLVAPDETTTRGGDDFDRDQLKASAALVGCADTHFFARFSISLRTAARRLSAMRFQTGLLMILSCP